MRRRMLCVGSLVLLAGCEYLYGVSHRADGPFSFDPTALQEVLGKQPGFRPISEWDGKSMAYETDRAWEYVFVSCSAEAVEVGSGWVSRVPADDVLSASLARQRDIVELLARAVPGFPPAAAFRVDWIGLESPLGDELAAAKARWEARPREK